MPLESVIKDNTSGASATVSALGHLQVNTPTDHTKAGAVQQTFVRDSSTARTAKITDHGEVYSATGRLLFQSEFNGSSFLNNQFNTQATTMAVALNGGFLRLNSGAITTSSTGCSVTTARSFSIEDGQVCKIRGHINHVNASVPNTQFDFGWGMYVVAVGQRGAMVEFIGFRWTVTGEFIGVVEYSAGGAPSTLTVPLNGGTSFPDNTTHVYEVSITDDAVEFYVNNTFVGTIELPNDASMMTKASSYPIIARLYNDVSTPSLAPVFNISSITFQKYGLEADIPITYRQSGMGKHISYNQCGIAASNGTTATGFANGTAPTATVGSNTAAAAIGLGGFYQMTATNIGTAANNSLVFAFQNPQVPIIAGAGTNGKVLVITGIQLSPMICSVAITGGGASLIWFITVGNNAVSLATTDAIGTTTIGTRSPRYIPLSTTDVIAAAAAVGSVSTRYGDSSIMFDTPIFVNPGEYISVGVRTITATAAVTAGALSGSVGFNGYWE